MLDSGMLGEVTLRSSAASLVRSVAPVAGSAAGGTALAPTTGTLTLTSARLKFEPGSGLLQGGPLSIPLADILRVDLGATALVIPNRIVVVRRDGRKHELVVADRDGWAGRIRALLPLRA